MLLEMAGGGDASVRVASYRALRELAGAGEIEALVALWVAAAGGERKPLEQAVLGVAARADAGTEASKAVLGRFDSVRDSQFKAAMIGVLGRLGDASALATLRGALTDADAGIRHAAMAGLGQWPDATPLPDLFRVARDGQSSDCRIRALRAAVALVATARSLEPTERVRHFATAMELGPDTTVKRRILGSLGSLRVVEAMQLAASYVQDEQVRDEAALATVLIGEQVHLDDPAASRKALEQVLAADVGDRIRERAIKALDEI